MPLVFRGSIKQAKWFKDPIRPWLERGEIPADPLTDLNTSDNEMSVWIVDDAKSNLERTIAAVAATRGQLDKYDYLLFDERILLDSGIRIGDAIGTTQDAEINQQHRDLQEISGSRLLALVAAILQSEFETARCQPFEVKELLRRSVHQRYIQRETLPQKLQEQCFPE